MTMESKFEQMLREFHEETKVRYRELGVIDGLLAAQDIVRAAGYDEAALLLVHETHIRLGDLDAGVETDRVMDRLKNPPPSPG